MKVVDLYMELAKGKVIVYDSFECELFRGSDRPRSNLVRGMIAGWATELFKRKVSVKEVKCIAKDDPYCEFVIEATS